MLGGFLQEGAIEGMELSYGFDDLPLLDELAPLLRGGAQAWKDAKGIDATVLQLQRDFVHAFLSGLDVAAQLHLCDGDGLRLEASLVGVFDGRVRRAVREPLDTLAREFAPAAENAFVTFQDQILKAVASTRDEAMLLDFWASGYLWASLAGVEAGLVRSPQTA